MWGQVNAVSQVAIQPPLPFGRRDRGAVSGVGKPPHLFVIVALCIVLDSRVHHGFLEGLWNMRSQGRCQTDQRWLFY